MVNKEEFELTAAEAREEIRRIKDVLDGDTQNHFDWATFATEQRIFDRQTMIIYCDSALTVSQKTGFDTVHTVLHALEGKNASDET